MTFSFGFSPWFIIPILIVAGLASWWLYKGTKDLLPTWLQVLLGTFRFIVITLLGVLLLQPLLNSLNKISFAPIVAVLQDVSESMVIHPDSSKIRSDYPAQLAQFAGDFQNSDQKVELWGFSDDLQRDLNPDSINFDKAGTHTSFALQEVIKKYRNQNLSALVLVSDGISTAGANPLYQIEGFQQPVFTVLVGDTTAQRDLRIKDILFNEIAYLKGEMPIRVIVEAQGYDQAPVTVTISGEGKVLDSQKLELNNRQTEGSVDFLIKPEKVGLIQYKIEISRLDKEITYQNNRQLIFVNVLETRVKIALFGGAPHPDIGALKEAFEQDERYECTVFLKKDKNSFYEYPLDYNLEDFDLFILHNYPSGSTDGNILQQISTQVKDNKKPMMVFVGAFTDISTLRFLTEYMALSPVNFSNRSEEVIVNFLPSYKQHSTFTFDENWLRWVNSTPPIFRNRSEWQPKANAEVFATAKIKNIDVGYPVFAVQNQLGRKNMVFLGENIWRMRAQSYIEEDNFGLFDDWLFNNVKWLIVSDDKRKFKVTPSKPVFNGNEAITFRGQVYDDSYNPVSGAEIKLTLTSPNGNEDEYYLNEVSSAQYFLEFFNQEEGTYTYVAEGRNNGQIIGRDQGQFSVGKSNIEHLRLQANKDLMEQIALRTGGEMIHVNNFGELPEKIRSLATLVPKVDYQRSTVSFHDWKWLLILLLLFLSVEWIIRKLYSLL